MKPSQICQAFNKDTPTPTNNPPIQGLTNLSNFNRTPTDYPGGWFRTICPHCHRGYDLVELMVDEELLAQMLCSHRTARWMQKPKVSQKLFQYLRSTALEFRFVSSTGANAVLFQVGGTRSIFPIAIYFQSTYYRFQPLNRLLFSALVAAIGALILMTIGLSLIPVVVGGTGALLCFWHFTALPKIKGIERHRLLSTQTVINTGRLYVPSSCNKVWSRNLLKPACIYFCSATEMNSFI